MRSPLHPAMDGASSREGGGDPNLRPRAFSPVHRFLLGPSIFSSALLRAPNFPGALRLLCSVPGASHCPKAAANAIRVAYISQWRIFYYGRIYYGHPIAS